MTNSGTIHWSSRILRFSGTCPENICRHCRLGLPRVLATTGQCPVPLAAAGSVDEFRNHRLKFLNSANPQDSLRIEDRHCRLGLPRVLATTVGRHRLERPRSAVFRDLSGKHLSAFPTRAGWGRLSNNARPDGRMRGSKWLSAPPTAPPDPHRGLFTAANPTVRFADTSPFRGGFPHPAPHLGNRLAIKRSVQPTSHSGNNVSFGYSLAWIIVFSGWGLGRRLFQKGGLPSVT